MTNSQAIARVLLEAGAVLLRPEDPFTFASGLRSPVYCDNRLLIGNVAARRAVAAAFAERCGDAEVVAGPATGGIPWAAWAAELAGLPMAYVRGAAKEHGRGRQVEGAAVAGRRVALLEDTISTGESVLAAARALREEGAEVVRVVGIFTWGWEATNAAFAEAGLTLQTLTRLPDVLDVASAEGRLTSAQRKLVEAWAADPKGWSAPMGRAAVSTESTGQHG